VVGGELLERAGGPAEESGDPVGDPLGVAFGGQAECLGFISAIGAGTPARIMASLFPRR